MNWLGPSDRARKVRASTCPLSLSVVARVEVGVLEQ